MRFKTVAFLLIVFTAAISLQSALSQDDAPQYDMQKMMEIHQKVTTPGPAHKLLEAFLGEWKSTSKVWLGGPASPEVEIETGVSVGSWLMEGRWVQIETRGEEVKNPMLAPFMPTHTFAIIGYDNAKKKYVYTHVANKSTDMMRSVGIPERDGSAIVFYGELDEPMMGEYDKPVKATYRLSPDKIVLDIYDLGMGEKNNRVIETTLTRIQK